MFIATTALTLAGIEACTDFLEAVSPRLKEAWLPLPVEVCRGEHVDLGPLERYLEPLLSLYHEVRGRWRCYGTAEELKRRELAAVKLAALVIKARVYGKIDLAEWDRYFSAPPPAPPPTPALAIGAVPRREYIICGAHPPNPVETAHELWNTLSPRQRLELARWIVKFITAIVESTGIDEAYFKIVREGWPQAYHSLTSGSSA